MAGIRKAQKTVVSARFNAVLVERLRELADDENRNLSNMMENILIEYVSKVDSKKEVEQH